MTKGASYSLVTFSHSTLNLGKFNARSSIAEPSIPFMKGQFSPPELAPLYYYFFLAIMDTGFAAIAKYISFLFLLSLS